MTGATQASGTVSKQDLMAASADIISEFYPDKMTLRQVYYQLVSRLIIENKQTAYKRLSSVLVEARETGVVEWDAMEDRTRSIVGSPSLSRIGDPSEMSTYYVDQLRDTEGIYADRWLYQPYYVEVWLEKQALEGVFASVTDRLSVVLMPGRGYSSATFLKDAADRLLEAQNENKKVAVLYFGDYDPSGMDIERYGAEKLQEHGVFDVDFSRVSLTLDQIKEHKLPPVPAKKTDSRRDAFVAVHGDMAVELDAIRVDTLKRLIKEAILHFWNDDAWSRRCDEKRTRVAKFRRLLIQKVKDLAEEWENEVGEEDEDDDSEDEEYVCPNCEEVTVGTLDYDGEVFCETCDDYFSPQDEADEDES